MMERRLMKEGLTVESLKAAKRIQMPDEAIAHFCEVTPKEVENFKRKANVHPDFKMVDTCAAEFEAHTPYYYSAYGAEDEVKPQGKGSVVVFGSGPIRGFAVVHCLGILTSLFSSVVVSRALVNLIYGRRRKLESLSIGHIWKPGNTTSTASTK